MRGYGSATYGPGPVGRARFAAGLWMRRLLFAAYLVIGLVVASSHHYLSSGRVDSLQGVAEAVLAVVLWPLVLLGVHMRL